MSCHMSSTSALRSGTSSPKPTVHRLYQHSLDLEIFPWRRSHIMVALPPWTTSLYAMEERPNLPARELNDTWLRPQNDFNHVHGTGALTTVKSLRLAVASNCVIRTKRRGAVSVNRCFPHTRRAFSRILLLWTRVGLLRESPVAYLRKTTSKSIQRWLHEEEILVRCCWISRECCVLSIMPTRSVGGSNLI